MEVALGLGVFGLVIVTFILPWVQRSRILKLQEEVRTLRSYLNGILVALSERGIEVTPHVKEARQEAPAPVSPEAYQPKAAAESIPGCAVLEPKPKPEPKPGKKKIGFEQQFGARLPVWIGGIALAFAGFYMVKYSIESGLLNETVRVTLGGIFGLALLSAGNWIRSKPNFANGTRIAQALSGAGIADLYVTFFTAANLYHLISPLTAFIGMAVVTGGAVILSLRHGAPIALMGLLGGFLTPALVNSGEPNTPLLFIYLYAVLSALMTVIRRQRWWWMTVPTMIGAFGWVVLWLFTDPVAGDAFWVGLFLLAISATVVFQSRKDMIEGALDNSHFFSFANIINYFSLGGACLLMGVVAYHSGFTLLEWSFFGLLAAGGIALAWLHYSLYWFAPWLALAVNIVMLASWNAPSHGDFILVLSCFAALYIGAGTLLTFKSHKPVAWAGLTVTAAFGYYLTAYNTLREASDPTLHIWGFIAIAIALAAIALTKAAITRFAGNDAERQRVLAIFALTVTAFAAIGATIELPREFLSIAIALEILAVSWINLRVDIRALRYIALTLSFVFAAILLSQLLLLVQSITHFIINVPEDSVPEDSIPIVAWPLFQLGIPALCFALSSYLLRRKQDGNIVRGFECGAVFLLSLMICLTGRNIFLFIEQSIVTLALFLLGYACFIIGRKFSRIALPYSGIALTVFSILRIFLFALALDGGSVGEIPIFNSLILAYAIPAALFIVIARELAAMNLKRLNICANGFALLMIFAFITLEVTQFYHGGYLFGRWTFLGPHDSYETTNAEIYAYSAVWLLLGIALLFYGTLTKDKMVRIASLIIMLLTVGKVFLYDASELTGLLRVFSFLGLGVSLIGLSYSYTRFVFAAEKPNE